MRNRLTKIGLWVAFGLTLAMGSAAWACGGNDGCAGHDGAVTLDDKMDTGGRPESGRSRHSGGVKGGGRVAYGYPVEEEPEPLEPDDIDLEPWDEEGENPFIDDGGMLDEFEDMVMLLYETCIWAYMEIHSPGCIVWDCGHRTCEGGIYHTKLACNHYSCDEGDHSTPTDENECNNGAHFRCDGLHIKAFCGCYACLKGAPHFTLLGCKQHYSCATGNHGLTGCDLKHRRCAYVNENCGCTDSKPSDKYNGWEGEDPFDWMMSLLEAVINEPERLFDEPDVDHQEKEDLAEGLRDWIDSSGVSVNVREVEVTGDENESGVAPNGNIDLYWDPYKSNEHNLNTIIEELTHSRDITSGDYRKWKDTATDDFKGEGGRDDPSQEDREGGEMFATLKSEYEAAKNKRTVTGFDGLLTKPDILYEIENAPALPANFVDYCNRNGLNVKLTPTNTLELRWPVSDI